MILCVALAVPARAEPFVFRVSPRTDDDMADAVFVGDSMVDDLEMLNIFPTANFVCRIGMSPLSVGRRQFRVRGSNELETTYQQIRRYGPKKIYILLGSNSLDNKNSELALVDYRNMLDEFIREFPGVRIFVISPPPMTRERMKKELGIYPRRFMNFEAGLRALCAELALGYIDLYHLVSDEEGYMTMHYAAPDGYHMNINAYQALRELILKR